MRNKVRVTVMAENIDNKTPSIKVTAKPLMALVENSIKTIQVKRVVKFESRIEGQAREKPS